MEALAAIGDWISERESLLSGAAAIIVLLGVLASAFGMLYRHLSKLRNADTARADSGGGSKITLQDLTAPAPYPIHFAESDGLRIAYAVQGDGPPDILVTPGIITHLNIMSHMPPFRDTVQAIAGFGRVVTYDKRGQGLSDPAVRPPTMEERVHDIEAVMDAAGMDEVVLYGVSEGGPMCLQFAHDHPERVKGLVLLGTTACWEQSEDFPMGIEGRALDSLGRTWGTGVLRDMFFPGITREQMDDKTYQAFENLCATRQSIRQLVEYMKQTDVRPLLPHIHCPALVIHFGGDLAVPVRLGRAVAEGLPNAEFLEVSGIDHADLSQSAEGIARIRQFVASL
ncbi:MAG: alpha/beta hydrolase [Halioglobus sp.]|nr:alpha/beta hydrolase [Halioglobus sp.]